MGENLAIESMPSQIEGKSKIEGDGEERNPGKG